MQRLVTLLVALAALASSAPIDFQANNGWAANFNGNHAEAGANGNMQGGMQGAGGMQHCSPEQQLKYVKVALQLFAPQDWSDKFDAIPAEGQTCVLQAWKGGMNGSHNAMPQGMPPMPTTTTTIMPPMGAAPAASGGDELAKQKQLISEHCGAWATQIGAFLDSVHATFAQLPASMMTTLKEYGMKQMQLQQQHASSPSGQAPNAQSNQAKMAEGAQHAQQFFSFLSSMSADDRAKAAAAFPKLTPFLTGPEASQFLTQAQTLFSTLASGNPQSNMEAIHTQGEALKNTLKSIWTQYSASNAAAIQKASALLGVDIGKQLTEQGTHPMMGGMESGGMGALSGMPPTLGGSPTALGGSPPTLGGSPTALGGANAPHFPPMAPQQPQQHTK